MRRLAEKNQAEIRREVAEEKQTERNAQTEDGEDSTSDSESLSTVLSRGTIARYASRASRQSGKSMHRIATATQYEENPYDIDLVNTRHSAISRKD